MGREMTEVFAPAVDYHRKIQGGLGGLRGTRFQRKLLEGAKSSTLECWTGLDLSADGNATCLRSEIVHNVHSADYPEELL